MAQTLNAEKQTAQEQSVEAGATSRRLWVLGLVFMALVFDGYDLVIYGAVLPTLFRDPSQLGPLTPELAGALGSYALVGVLIGALITGTLSDNIGRRKVVLGALVWFSIGMGLSAVATNTTFFGIMRFVTGVGVGALVATVGAVAAEFAPPGKKNLYVGVAYCGVPLGAALAALLSLLLLGPLGWRGLFWIGALPLVTLLPLAFIRLPESPLWLAAKGRMAEAEDVARKVGIPLPAPAVGSAAAASAGQRVGYAALFSREYILPTLLLGFMSFSGLLLTYGLNTWLPKILEDSGFAASSALTFLLLLNGGAVVGVIALSPIADRFGPKPIVAATFLLAAITIFVLTLGAPTWVLYIAIALAGVGTLGTQVLIYGFVSSFYRTHARGAGVAWCAGFGRLGGIGGPLVGGFLIGAGLTPPQLFLIFAVVALVGMVLTMLVPLRHAEAQPVPVKLSSTPANV